MAFRQYRTDLSGETANGEMRQIGRNASHEMEIKAEKPEYRASSILEYTHIAQCRNGTNSAK